MRECALVQHIYNEAKVNSSSRGTEQKIKKHTYKHTVRVDLLQIVLTVQPSLL